MYQVASPYQQFFDATGKPLEGGTIYVGTVSQNPVTAPTQVYWDEAGTQPAPQPLKTSGGYIIRNGTPARVYLGSDDYSLSIYDSKGRLVVFTSSVTSISTLRGDLADSSDNAKGDALVAVKRTAANAVATTLHDWMESQVFNVKADFGAKGDSSTDDTLAIQRANTAAQAVEGTVYFPRGTYKVTSSTTLSNRVDWVGERSAVLKRYAPVQIVNITGTYARVSGIDFDGNRSGYPYPTYGRAAIIFVTGSFNVVEDCFIYQGNSHGIGLDGQSTTCQYNMVHDNYISDCAEVGIAQNKTTDNIIAHNTIRNSGFEGITIDNACYRNVVSGNRLDGNCNSGGVGSIGMDGAELNSITGNVITATGSSLPGIKTQNNLAGCFYNTITGNTIIDGGAYGIHLYTNGAITSQHNTVTGNVIRGFSTGSVKLDVGCDFNVVTGNVSDKPVIDNGFKNIKQSGTSAFRARNNTLHSNVTGDDTLYQVPFDVEDFDAGGDFDTTTGTFTAPSDGFYQLNATVRLEGGTDQTYAFLQIVTTTETLQQGFDITTVTGTGTPTPPSITTVTGIAVFTPTVCGLVYMDKGNTAVVKVQCGGGTGGKIMGIVASPSLHQFSGFLVA
jgi:parallel beta-helix repeat protein